MCEQQGGAGVDVAAGGLHLWEVLYEKATTIYTLTQKSDAAAAAPHAAAARAAALGASAR